MINLFKKNQPLELSVNEIWESVLGKPAKNGGREIKLKTAEGKVRLIPSYVIETSKEYLYRTEDTEKVLRYIENSFYIYRECVNRGFFAPHYEASDVYEWPKLVEFSWSDIETIISGGEFLHGKIPSEKKGVIIERPGKNKTEIISINPETGNAKKYFRSNISEDLDKTLKYNIKDLSKVGVIFSQEWQMASLKNYANPIYYFLENFLNEDFEDNKGGIIAPKEVLVSEKLKKANENLENWLNYLESACITYKDL